jgi:hypothetical protein
MFSFLPMNHHWMILPYLFLHSIYKKQHKYLPKPHYYYYWTLRVKAKLNTHLKKTLSSSRCNELQHHFDCVLNAEIHIATKHIKHAKNHMCNNTMTYMSIMLAIVCPPKICRWTFLLSLFHIHFLTMQCWEKKTSKNKDLKDP